MMQRTKPKGILLPVILGLLLALPMWTLANNTDTNPDIGALKMMRHLQNQNTELANIKASAKQVNATEDQQRMLRLSNALSKITGQQTPHLNTSYRFQHDGAKFSAPTTHTQALRETIFGHGALKNANDSLYFNFLTGMNSADSLGMDVRITGNEGTNFGNEGASWGDPSLLYWIASEGNLEFVPMVSSIDDPDWNWTTVSWDWTAGNNGQPLAVGNLWAVYARTSHMYVALEVTYVEPWNQYFEFDYVIQTDGSNFFDGEPAFVDLMVNGAYGDTLEVGSNPYFEVTLGSEPGGEITVFWDSDHNGIWDDWDPPIEFYQFMDNDIHDENPADGIFGFTYTDEMADGINFIADDLLFVAFGSMDYAEVPVQFYSEPTAYSVSGQVIEDGSEEPIEGIVVWAAFDDSGMPAIIGVTDEMGIYHLDLPDSGYAYVGSEDYFRMTEGLFPDPSQQDVMVLGHEEGIDFIYMMPTSGITGVVMDEDGNPLEGIEVEAYNDGASHYGISDEDGIYYIPVNPGGYDVEVKWGSLPQPYVIPYSEWVEVGDFAPATLDIMLYVPNSDISGMVYLDEAPYPHAKVFGIMIDFGYSVTEADDEGYYVLPVYDDDESLYNLHVWGGENQEIIQLSQNWGEPGTTGEDIYLSSVSGGLFGDFINADTEEPITGSDDVGMMLADVETGMEYYGGPDNDGYYEIHVPPGMYVLNAGGMDWSFSGPDTVIIDEELLPYDIYLTPLDFESSLSGVIREMDGTPIPYAQVQIGNDGWGTATMAGPDGSYYFDLMPGHYYMHVWADGFQEDYFDLEIQYGENYQDIYLESFEADGVIYGMVYSTFDDMPLAGVNVYAYGGDMGFMFQTDESGQYWFELPNGVYDIVAEREGYIPFWGLGYEVNDDTTYLDIPLDLPDGGLEGYVYDDMGNIIQDAQIFLVGMADSIGFRGYSDGEGYYSVPTQNGDYQVFAEAEGFEPANLGMVTIDNDYVWMDITLYPRQFATPPEIAFIVDQPWDQGRNVRMQFWPGGTEWGPFMGYSVWRLTNTPMGEILDFVEYLPNHDLEAYNLVLPTLVDSSAYTTPDQYLTGFVVTGHWDTYGYIDGLPGVGYSIDNIHPGVPDPLMLLYSDDSQVDLQWEPSVDMDFQYFELLRATNPDFNDPTVEMTTMPGFSDMDIAVGQTYYYQVFAVDANGNRSDGSNVITTSIVSVDDAQALPSSFGLSQNYPNPFNPTTSIEFALPEASQVSLVIYNLLGQKVRTLVNGYIPAGYINTQWDGLDQNGNELSSGTYIYRLETAESSFSKKMVLMK